MSRPPTDTLPTGLQRLGRAAVRWLLGWWRVLYFGAQVLVLAATPSSYVRENRAELARQLVQGTAPILLGFTLLAALVTLVLTRIVVVTALSYGLSQYALQVVIRVLVLELIPLSAALFVALRVTLASSLELGQLKRSAQWRAWQAEGVDPLTRDVLPRVLAGVFASITLAALSCVVALLLAYVAVYGFTLSAWPAYTRLFGQVFSPPVTLIFALKTFFFSLAVALMPMASALHDRSASPRRPMADLTVLVRMFAVILLIEVVSLVGNYY